MKLSWLFALVLLAAVIAVALLSGRVTQSYSYQDDMAQAASKTIMALLAITLIVERGMTVINALLYGDAQRAADDKRRNAVPGGAEELAGILATKERIRLLGAFLAGLFISAAGVRTLHDLLVTKDVAANPLLTPVDIVLTAALIAGGSNGLSFLAQLIKDRLLAPRAPDVGVVVQAAAGTADPAALAAATDPYFASRQATAG